MATVGGAGTGMVGTVFTAENRTILEGGGELSIQKFWKFLNSDEFTRVRQVVDRMPDITLFYLTKQGVRVRYNTELTVSGTSSENERMTATVVGVYSSSRTGENGLVVEIGSRTTFIPTNRITTVKLLSGLQGGGRKRKSHRRRQQKRKTHRRRHH